MTIQEIQQEIKKAQGITKDPKFKKAISDLIDSGVDITFKTAGSGKYYIGKNDKMYKYRIAIGKKRIYTGRVKRFWNASINESTFNSTPAIYDNRPESIKESYSGRFVDIASDEKMIECVKDEIQKLTWGSLAHTISKMIDSDMVVKDTCWRCNGQGYIPAYSHIYGGVCFKCCGVGGKLVIKDKVA